MSRILSVSILSAIFAAAFPAFSGAQSEIFIYGTCTFCDAKGYLHETCAAYSVARPKIQGGGREEINHVCAYSVDRTKWSMVIQNLVGIHRDVRIFWGPSPDGYTININTEVYVDEIDVLHRPGRYMLRIWNGGKGERNGFEFRAPDGEILDSWSR